MTNTVENLARFIAPKAFCENPVRVHAHEQREHARATARRIHRLLMIEDLLPFLEQQAAVSCALKIRNCTGALSRCAGCRAMRLARRYRALTVEKTPVLRLATLKNRVFTRS